MAKLLPNAAELCRKAFFFFYRKEGSDRRGNGTGMARAQAGAGAPLDKFFCTVYNR